MQFAELASSYEADKLLNAVVGPISEDRHLWRINWLKRVLDAVENGELAITDKCDDPEAMYDALHECHDMVRAVNKALENVHPWSKD